MESSIFNAGIDTGYFDTKSQSTTIPSGYTKCSKKPFMVKDYLLFNDSYYVLDESRFSYEKNRTSDDKIFILTLFSIAKEIVTYYGSLGTYNTAETLQCKIDTIENLILGVGLPPAYFSSQTDELAKYYKEEFGNGVDFVFNDLKFHLMQKQVNIYPQDFAAAVYYKRLSMKYPTGKNIMNHFDDYYAIDIGGYTVDLVASIDGQLKQEKSFSIGLGTIVMFDNIITSVESTFGLTVTMRLIECVLNDKPTILEEDVKSYIRAYPSDWINKIVNTFCEKGIDFSVMPAVFLGGGTLLFKSAITSNKLLKSFEFIPDPRANARAYAEFNSMLFNDGGN